MKLIEAKDGQFVFHFAKRERLLLTHVLRLYPVGSGAIAPLSKSGDEQKLAEHEAALAEALAENRAEQKRLVDAFLGEEGRFDEDNRGYRLRLSVGQVRWLLQVLNEVRVGRWVQLGRPPELAALVMAGQVEPVAEMEICAFFQTQLLAALASAQ